MTNRTKKSATATEQSFTPSADEWNQLQQSGRKKLWKLARLSLDLTTRQPLPGTRELTGAKLAVKDAIHQLSSRRETFLENLVDHPDPQRLQYITPLPLKSFKQDINRLVDVTVFVDFCLLRKMSLPLRLIEIAELLRKDRVPERKDSGRQGHVGGSSRPDSIVQVGENDLYIALLGQYIKNLAVEQKAPPKTLIIGAGRLNASGLARAIEESGVINQRKISGDKTKTRRLSPSTMRRMPIALAKASNDHWGPESAEEGDEIPAES